VAQRSKVRVCGRSLSSNSGSNAEKAWISVSCDLSNRRLCDGPINRPEESYRLWRVTVCDQQTSRIRRPWPTFGCCARGKTWNGKSGDGGMQRDAVDTVTSLSMFAVSPKIYGQLIQEITKCITRKVVEEPIRSSVPQVSRTTIFLSQRGRLAQVKENVHNTKSWRQYNPYWRPQLQRPHERFHSDYATGWTIQDLNPVRGERCFN
jgi:hypothetical protein